MDKAILVGLDLGTYNINDSMKELENLTKALQIDVLLHITQHLDRPNVKSYVGSGKLLEIKQAVLALDATMVIFDDELSPAQIRTLENTLDTQIIDRSFLILSIFSERAKTKGAFLEVSLAQQKYLLPRLVGMRDSLSRQGGGTYNAKGPGETKLELDRRVILSNITKLERSLKKLEQEKETSRKSRYEQAIPLVSLVGYTNAGKSATLNSLLRHLESDKKVYEKDELFATLDTTARRIQKKGYPTFIITDTIGFLSRLPHAFIASFKSTLSEVNHSNLILHIIDGTHPNKELHEETTLQVLKELDAQNIQMKNVYTRLDLLDKKPNDSFWISNLTDENIHELIELIYSELFGEHRYVTLSIPYDKQHIVNLLNEETKVLKTTYDTSISIQVVMYQKQLNTFSEYVVSTR